MSTNTASNLASAVSAATPHPKHLSAAKVLHAVETIAARNSHVYRRAFAAGTPVPVDPRGAAQVGRYTAGSDPEPVTCFHSLHVPGVSLDGVTAVIRHATAALDDYTCLFAVTLMRRYECTTCLPLTSHMVHRLYLACLVVAVKVHHDAVLSTRAFASLCGVTAKDLAREERQLLRAIGYRALVTLPELETAAAAIIHAAAAAAIPDSPPFAAAAGGNKASPAPTDEVSSASTVPRSLTTSHSNTDDKQLLLRGPNPLCGSGGDDDDDDGAFVAVGGASV